MIHREPQSLRSIIEQIVRDNPRSTLRLLQTDCVLCGETFESFGLRVNGVDYSPDMCHTCLEEFDYITYLCPTCGRRMYRYVVPRNSIPDLQCPNCYQYKDTAEAKLQRAQRRFEQVCPKEYRETSRELLPIPSAYDRALQWHYGDRGLMLHGETGKGKTRAAYGLVRQLLLDGRTVTVYTGGALSDEISATYSDTSQVRSWFVKLTAPDVLMIDDLGKMSFSDRVASVLFEIVERRTSQGRPMIITTDDTGRTLKAKIRDQTTAEAIVRRFREFFDVIQFTAGGNSFPPE